jgi:hypothetical protein
MRIFQSFYKIQQWSELGYIWQRAQIVRFVTIGTDRNEHRSQPLNLPLILGQEVVVVVVDY